MIKAGESFGSQTKVKVPEIQEQLWEEQHTFSSFNTVASNDEEFTVFDGID